MARTIGAKDRSRGRVRDETEDQRSARVAKTAETRKANKRKKDDAERGATAHRKHRKRHRSLVLGDSGCAALPGTSGRKVS